MATSSEVYMVKMKNTEFKKGKNVINNSNNNKWYNNKNVNKKKVHKKNDSIMRNNEVYNCKKCGKKHKPREFYAFNKMCGICKKMNHFAVVCKKGSNEKREVHETHYVNDELF